MLKIFQLGSTTRTPIEEANWIQTKFLVGWGSFLGVAIFAGALGAAIGRDSWTHLFQVFFQVLAIGIVVAGACAMVAWLLGLLFGIPKSIATLGVPIQAPNPAPANSTQSDSRQPTSRVNTNLEDVSDWLTKTLIGVGLTQLTSMPHTLWHYATILDQASLKSEGGGAVFILSVAAAGGAGGFWVGYVTTRTFLTLLFDLFDKPQIGDVTVAAKPDNLTLGADQKPIPSADPAVKAADQKLRSVRLDQLSAPMDIAAWGAAQARALNLGTALQAVRQAAAAAPNNEDIKALLAKVEQANKSNP
ncbi:MAG: hypothetical protein WB764_13530 [Xanthobacteraceae bacterium]